MKTKNFLSIIGLVAIVLTPWEKSFSQQEPVKPSPNKSEEVTFINDKNSVALKDTLTIPELSFPHTDVALISDSIKNQPIANNTPSLFSDIKFRQLIWDIIPNEKDMLNENDLLKEMAMLNGKAIL